MATDGGRSRRRSRGGRRRKPAVAADAAVASLLAPLPLDPTPRPGRRRAVFFDVENSSRSEHLATMLGHLGLHAIARETQLMAVGNWRVIGQESAQMLARHGATLTHSAPAFGVKDWSDLRIAVAAGVWLGNARPGDVIEIVTDDQAFDAVGDVAASLGVGFRRLSYRTLLGAGVIASEPKPASRRGRRSRDGRARPAEPRRRASGSPPAHAPAGGADPVAATPEEIVEVVRGLVGASSDGSISLDALSNALKARGFGRPPGSLRLITRLRRIAALDVTARGTIRLA